MNDDFRKVQRVLRELPVVMREKVVSGATGAAARVVRDEAKRLVPVRTGMLQKSIIAKKARKSDQPRDGVRYIILPKTQLKVKQNVILRSATGETKGKSITRKNTFYGRFIHEGTKHMTANPFLLNAARDKKDAALSAFRQYVITRTEKEVARLAR